MAEYQINNLRMVAWEITRSCNLSCLHCRAESEKGPYPGELSTEECFKVIDDIASFAKPVIILTGGEPLLRKDVFEIAAYGTKQGLTMVMAPNGTLLTEENAKQALASGIKKISISLDGPDAESHDKLRQVPGALEGAIKGIKIAQAEGIGVQINSTISKRNIHLLDKIIKLAEDLKVDAYHLFLLVPAGRGKLMEDEELSPEQYEKTLEHLAQKAKDSSMEIKTTCAPHYNRLLVETHQAKPADLKDRGCMGGISFCFISHLGDLQPCGYLVVNSGNVRQAGFKKAWTESKVFNDLRDLSNLKGKCGVCEYKRICGGCRARAYAKHNDYLAPEPYCIYETNSVR